MEITGNYGTNPTYSNKSTEEKRKAEEKKLEDKKKAEESQKNEKTSTTSATSATSTSSTRVNLKDVNVMDYLFPETAKSTFNFDELQELVTKDFNKLLARLKDLKSSGVVSSIKVKVQENGQTSATVEHDGIEYEFLGTQKNEAPQEAPTTSTTPSAPSTPTTPTTPAAPEKTESEDNKGIYDIDTGVKTGASKDYDGKMIDAYDMAWYGSGPNREKDNLINAATHFPEIYQPFVEAGLIKMNQYGDYEITDQEAVDKLFGNSNGLGMDELKQLLTGRNFDAEKIKAFIENQPPLDNGQSFIDKFPEEGMDVSEFIQQYREYPDVLEAFVQADMINIGRWNEISESRGFSFLTRNTDGKITKDVLQELLTDGNFDAEKIVEHAGMSYEGMYVNRNKTKAEFAEKHNANYEAAQKYMEYFDSLSYTEKRSLREDPNSTVRFVEYYLEQYEEIMNDVYSGNLNQWITNMQFYTRNDIDQVVKKIALTNPELLS